jgi:hypothetical protein
VVFVPSLQALIASNGADSDTTAFFSSLLAVYGLIFLIAIPVTVYQYMMQIQSGAVGAAMNRWAIFGINLLTGFVLGVALNIILQPIIFAAVFHSASSFTTFPVVTPSP